MKKHFISKSDKVAFGILGLFCGATLFLSACDLDKSSAEVATEQKVKPTFSVKNEQLGQATYKALLKTVRQAKEADIDLKDKAAIEALAYEHSLKELKAVNLISDEEFLQAQSAPKPTILMGATVEKAAKEKPKLSIASQKILAKVQVAIKESPTYKDFTKKLKNINDEIVMTVPVKEQEAVQRGIAVLHYSLEAIDVLDKEGLLKKVNQNKKVEKAGFLSFLLDPGDKDQKKKSSWWNSWGRCARYTLQGIYLGMRIGKYGGTAGIVAGIVVGSLVGGYYGGCFD